MPIDRLTNLLKKAGIAAPNPTIGTFPWDNDGSQPVSNGYAVPPPYPGPGNLPMIGNDPPPGAFDTYPEAGGRVWDEIKDPGIIPQVGPPPSPFDTDPVINPGRFPGGGGGGAGGGRPGMHRDQHGVWHYDSPVHGGGGGGRMGGGRPGGGYGANALPYEQRDHGPMNANSDQADIIRRAFGINPDGTPVSSPQGSPASAPYAVPPRQGYNFLPYQPRAGSFQTRPASPNTRFALGGLTSAFVNMLAQRRAMRQAAMNPEFARGLSGTRPT